MTPRVSRHVAPSLHPSVRVSSARLPRPWRTSSTSRSSSRTARGTSPSTRFVRAVSFVGRAKRYILCTFMNERFNS